jgi:hypothetical protein
MHFALLTGVLLRSATTRNRLTFLFNQFFSIRRAAIYQARERLSQAATFTER